MKRAQPAAFDVVSSLTSGALVCWYLVADFLTCAGKAKEAQNNVLCCFTLHRTSREPCQLPFQRPWSPPRIDGADVLCSSESCCIESAFPRAHSPARAGNAGNAHGGTLTHCSSSYFRTTEHICTVDSPHHRYTAAGSQDARLPSTKSCDESCIGVPPDPMQDSSSQLVALGTRASWDPPLLLQLQLMLGEGDAAVPASAHRSRSTESRHSFQILGGSRRLRQRQGWRENWKKCCAL